MAKAVAIKDDYEYIATDFLIPSPTNPRTTFTEEALDELAESIKVHGIIEPLVVRVLKKTNTFEIVCGHRRHRASLIAGLQALPCIVRTLTDEQVIDQQIHENLKREDLDPIDEATTYQMMRDKGATLVEITARAGRGETYVTKRLQLNNLIDAVKEDVRAGYLTLSVAVEMSKYPADTQDAIYERLYNTKWVHPETGVEVAEDEEFYDEEDYDEDGNFIGDNDGVPTIENNEIVPIEVPDKTQLRLNPNAIARFVENDWMLDLASAPFALDAKNLREDGLACMACSERTGANAGLFDNMGEDKDFCLNRNCFITKRVNFIQIERKALAKELKVEPKEIPLMHANYNDRRLLPESVVTTLFEGFRTGRSEDIDPESERESDKPCEFSVMAMNTRGEHGLVCFEDTGCTQHHWGNRNGRASQPTSEETAEAEQKKKRDRREEIFDCKVAEVVRVEVVTQAAEKFAKTASLTDHTDTATARLWQTISYNDKNSLDKFLKGVGLTLPDVRDPWNNTLAYEVAVKAMSFEDRAKLLLILSHYWKGDVRMNQFKTQKGVRDVAEYFKINYALIDAQQRLEFASKKEKKKFEAYLQQVEVNDPDARIPRVYSEGYLSIDEKPEAEPEPEDCSECGREFKSDELNEMGFCVDCEDAESDPDEADDECEECTDFIESESAHGTSYTDEEIEQYHINGHDEVLPDGEGLTRTCLKCRKTYLIPFEVVGDLPEPPCPNCVEAPKDELSEIADELSAMFDEEEVTVNG